MNSQMEPNFLHCYESVAQIFTWGKETPTHALACIIFEFSMLCVLTFHTCCSFLSLTHLMCACLANGVILLRHLGLLMCCLRISCFHTPHVDVLVVKVLSQQCSCCSCLHTFKCELITFVFVVPIVMELNLF